jgi:phosphoenolpyruvate synthase/pyruvate phosphate dikinase
MACTDDGITLAPLPYDKAKTAPLNAGQVNQLFQLAHNLEQQFGSPQDIEWTLSNNRLFIFWNWLASVIKSEMMTISI